MSNPKEEIKKLQEDVATLQVTLKHFVVSGKYSQISKDVLKRDLEIKQARLETWKQALTSEIKFLQVLGGTLIVENHPERYRALDKIDQRIAEVKGALE